MIMYISIDAGGTNTRVVGAAELANPVFLAKPLRRKNTHIFENDMSFIIEAAHKLASGHKIEAVGIGVPGIPNADKTGITFASNLSSWANKPLVESLSEGLHCPVFYDTDIAAAGLGEAYYGQVKGDFDYIMWGTGIGGGKVRYEGSTPSASAINWFTNFEAWEHDNGGAALTKKFGKAPEDFSAADWELVAKDFRRHLVGYLKTHKPRTIIFGGGLAVKHTDMIEEAGRNLGTRIKVTTFGDNSGLVGGFALIRSRLAF